MLRASVRVLDRSDVAAALQVCAQDAVSNVFVAAAVKAHGLDRHSRGEMWGWYDGGRLTSLCWSGANLVPVQAGPEAIDAFAARARRQGRQCSSIVGPADAVHALWARLANAWGPARDVRADQPVLALGGPPAVAADPLVRRSEPLETDLVLPACIAMFTEEVGYSPNQAGGASVYRSQVGALVASGRSLVRIERTPAGPQVVFKAELGSVTDQVVQIQGVWVAPERRGQGLAAPGMAAVVEVIRQQYAPVASLYVNSYNTRALAAYHRVGFRQVGTFATVLF